MCVHPVTGSLKPSSVLLFAVAYDLSVDRVKKEKRGVE